MDELGGQMAEDEKYWATYNEAYRGYLGLGMVPLSCLAVGTAIPNPPRKLEQTAFEDPLVQEVINSLRREIFFLEKQLGAKQEE